jgi:large subunit ribosomal protein L21
MYAVIETGGKQYRVAPGQTVELDTIDGDIGSVVEFARVLAVSNESNELLLGDSIATTKVRAKITEHGRAPKIIVFKFKRKKQYKRTLGHRQNYTRVRVEEIVS